MTARSRPAALEVLYLVVKEKRKADQDLTGRVNGWRRALNTCAIMFADRITEN